MNEALWTLMATITITLFSIGFGIIMVCVGKELIRISEENKIYLKEGKI